MAIDYGLKRTGLAATDPLQIVCSPLETVETAKALEAVLAYAQAEGVEAVVLGLPVNLDGADTDATEAVRKFKKALAAKLPETPIHYVDERFTSKMAKQAMLAGGMSKKNRRVKANVDRISAAIILQYYMDHGQTVQDPAEGEG